MNGEEIFTQRGKRCCRQEERKAGTKAEMLLYSQGLGVFQSGWRTRSSCRGKAKEGRKANRSKIKKNLELKNLAPPGLCLWAMEKQLRILIRKLAGPNLEMLQRK